MKTLLRQLWNEPAAFGHAVNAVLQIAQVLTVSDRAVNALLVAVGAALFGATTRGKVKPV